MMVSNRSEVERTWDYIQRHPDFESYKETRLTDESGDFHGWEITLKRRNGVQAARSCTLDEMEGSEEAIYWQAMRKAASVVFPKGLV